MTKPYTVTVDFNFEGQKNKYKEELETIKAQGGFRDARPVEAKSANHGYVFKCSFPGVSVGDILVVSCATGYQVVKATKVAFPHTIPEHATARIIAKLDLPGIERMESQSKAYEALLLDIEAEAQRVAERKYYKKLAKLSPEMANLIEMKELLEGRR